MDAIHRILIPTAFSHGAGEALRQAVVLADQLGAELHLLHVITGPLSDDGGMISFPEMEELRIRMRTEALRYRSSLLQPTRDGDLPIRCAVRRHEDSAGAILQYTGDYQIDLIVIAPKGRRQGGHLVLGSTAERVVRLAPCDVLTSGRRGLYRPDILKRILVPVDFSPQSAIALQRARRLARGAQTRALLRANPRAGRSA